MLRRSPKLIAGGLAALALCLAGCGDSSKPAEPKVANPNAPKLQPQQAPGLGGGPPAKSANKGAE
jgi:hypothetical protein